MKIHPEHFKDFKIIVHCRVLLPCVNGVIEISSSFGALPQNKLIILIILIDSQYFRSNDTRQSMKLICHKTDRDDLKENI